MAMNPLIAQTIGYAVVLLISIYLIAFLQRGFFFKFLAVRASLGKRMMVKIRDLTTDHFAVGTSKFGFLGFKDSDGKDRMIAINRSQIYKCLGINWVDIDNEKNAVVNPDFSTVSGFDAVKYKDLYTRALYSPQIGDDKLQKIMMVLLVVLLVATLVSFALNYGLSSKLELVRLSVEGLKSVAQASVSVGAT